MNQLRREGIWILERTIKMIKKNLPNYTQPRQLAVMKAHLKKLEARVEKLRFEILIEENFDDDL